ncbi:MAG: YraN family protein [Prevotellaceae bacterium]|jgi:putative endonuclease|nr:YraN family protein [Prevotellaceae bacterium]
MSLSYDFGKHGEKQAIAFLQKAGYNILEKNWRSGHKELDIIAEYDNELHIIEVKARTSDLWQTSTDVVGIKKQKNIIDAAEEYIKKKQLDLPVVFDIIYILQNSIELITNAFTAMDFAGRR